VALFECRSSIYSTNSWQLLAFACFIAGVAKRITNTQKALAKELRAAGNSWPAVSKKAGISERSLQYIAKAESWPVKCSPQRQPAKADSIAPVDIGQLAELIKNRLAEDIQASVAALGALPPASLELGQLEKRERVADSVQKRAASLFDIGQSEQAVVNIAVLSQLPEAINT
jgi:hypothetical protein